MEINTHTPRDTNEFAELLRRKYGTHKNLDYFLQDALIAYKFCIESENILFIPMAIYEQETLVAHAALICDKRLPSGEAFFGFLETPDNQATFTLLWDALIAQARTHNLTLLKGPVSGSIWHQYRSIKETDGSEFFIAEPMTETYYYDLLISKRPASEVAYFSAYRTHFDIVLKLLGAVSYTRLSVSGFSIKETKQVSPEQMHAIANITKEIFHSSWGYTELTEREFLQLYSPEKIGIHLNTLYLLYKGEEIIGFLSTAKENDSTLVCKTICILPQYQGQGLGNALAYKVHLDAGKDGITKIIYALIREGNAIKKFPKESAVIFRQYAAFEFTV